MSSFNLRPFGQAAWHDAKVKYGNPFYGFLLFGRCLGLHYADPLSGHKSNMTNCFSFIYSTAVITVLLIYTGLNAYISFNQTFVISMKSFLKISAFFYYTHGLLACVHLMILQRTSTVSFMKDLGGTKWHTPEVNEKTKKVGFILIGVCISFSVLAALFTVLLHFDIIKLPHVMTTLARLFPEHPHLAFVDAAAAGLCMAAATFCTGLYALMCYFVSLQVDNYAASISEIAKNYKMAHSEYRTLIQISKAVDSRFSWFCFCSFSMVIFLAAMFLFNIFGQDGQARDNGLILVFIGLLLLSKAQGLFICLPAILLFEKGKKPADIISHQYTERDNASLNKLNSCEYFAVALFLRDVESEKLGITLGGFFTVRRSFILSVSSLMISYSVLMILMSNYEFKVGS